MNNEISRSIDLLRVISILLVVMLHARTGLEFSVERVTYWSGVASRGFGALGVPVFLVISGYLAGIKRAKGAAAESWGAWRRRAQGLLTGYVFWNTLVALLALAAVWLHASMGSFLTGKLAGGWLSVYGLNDQFPIAYQFWFIRELLLFSFTVFAMERLWPWSRLVVAALGLVSVVALLGAPGRSQIAAVAYVLGYLAGRQGWVMAVIAARCHHGVWLGAVGAAALMSLAVATTQQAWGSVALLSFTVLGTVALMGGVIALVSKGWRMDALARWAPTTFFIFAAHEPLLALLRKVLVAHFGVEWAYVLAPTVAVAMLMSLYRLVPQPLKDRVWFVFSGTASKDARVPA